MRNAAMPEYLDIVDADDRVVGKATRAQVHRDHLMHRGVHVLVLSQLGHILVQVRSASLENHPGNLDASAGGHVLSGESYRAAAERELFEELGCHSSGIEYLLTYDGFSVRQLEKRALFIHRCDGPFHPDPQEVAGIDFLDPQQLVEAFASRPCTEGFMRSVSYLFDYQEALGIPTPEWRWQ
jgi:isopentenyldiphosphate isomerase